VKYGFIEGHRCMAPLKVICRVLGVSVSGFLAWRHHPLSARRQRDAQLAPQIAASHAASRETYGAPRIHADLRAAGEPISRKRVARLMTELGIAGACGRRRIRTTDSNHDNPVADNLLQRDFTATAPNQRWVTDITAIPTDEGTLFLSAIEDLFSRKVVGWAMDAHMETSLIVRALDMAISNRRPKAGLIHHSDRGCQYTSGDYRQHLAANGMDASMSRRGDCYDNACAESFWGRLKVELVYRQHYRTRADAQAAIFEFIEVFYNRTRRHSAIGYLSPEAFEVAYHRGQAA
jgi:transposase InsO family protein